MITSSKIAKFTHGWAIIPFSGKKAHFWADETNLFEPIIDRGGRIRMYQSKCNVSATGNNAVRPLHRGDFPKCKRCIQALKIGSQK